MVREADTENTPHLEDGELEAGDGVDNDGVYKESEDDKEWIKVAQAIYRTSDDWFNSSVKKDAERAISNFRSKHPSGSKYHTTYYDKRSRLFRPKTRSMVRATEAAAGVAFFSTADAVKCRPFYETNKDQAVAAQIFTDLLNHRLTDTEMHWFLTVLGATQDASTVGVIISHQDWQYEERDGVVYRDTPFVELIPLENFRISPAAKWYDPIGTSPFVVWLMPTYVGDIKAKMQKLRADGKTTIYRQTPEGILKSAQKQEWDTIRRARNGERVDPLDANYELRDHDTVWVHRNIVRDQETGVDMCFDTLGAELMLSSEVLPLGEVYKHNMRPFAMGFMVIETHKIYPAGPVGLVEPLQEEANDMANLRLDNIRLALGKRYVVKRGRGVDTTSLTRNVPSSVTMVSDTAADIKELTTQDVTQSSYEEQDRINQDFDELAGRFSGSSVSSNRRLNETVGGMQMLKDDANIIQEYQIRVEAETWLEPVMRQLIALEATYESDKELLTAVGERHSLSAEQVLEKMRLSKRVKPGVDVGFNATNPEKRVQKLALGLNTLGSIFPGFVQQADVGEVTKEVMGALGYKDGARFFPSLRPGGDDPRIAVLQQQIQQLQQQLESGEAANAARIRVAEIGGQARVAVAQIAAEVETMKIEAGANKELLLAKMKLRLEQIDRAIAVEDSDIRRRELYLQREALSHNIIESDRQYNLEMRRLGQERENKAGERMEKQADRDHESGENQRDRDAAAAEGGEKPKGNGAGPMNLAGNDKAGVIARDDFGEIPQAGG